MELVDKKVAIEAVGLNTWAGSRISTLPTVEAIPIEWIDGYIKRRANDVNIYAEILFISDMVKEWEKEK